MTTTEITAAGYIVHDDSGVIYGYGATDKAAWDDMRTNMELDGIKLLGEDDDATDELGSWTRESSMTVMPASKALLEMVEVEGGDCSWSNINGIACTTDEETDE